MKHGLGVTVRKTGEWSFGAAPLCVYMLIFNGHQLANNQEHGFFLVFKAQ